MRKRLTAILVGAVLLLVVIGGFLLSQNKPGNDNKENNLEENKHIESIQAENVLEKDEFQVTFLSNDGTILLVDVVERGKSAVPPVAPAMPTGYVFSHWDTDFTNVQMDLEVRAVCVEVPQDCNVLAFESASGKVGEEVTLPLRLTGDVCIAGFDVVVSFDPNCLEFVKMSYEDGSVLTNANAEKGQIYLNYLSTNNTTGEVDLCDCVFRIIGQEETTTVDIAVESAVAVDEQEQFYTPECQVINATVTIQR